MRNSINKTTDNQLFRSELVITQYQQITQKIINRSKLAARQKERKMIALQIQDDLNQILIAALLYIDQAKTDDESREMCPEKSGIFISTVIKELTAMSRTLEAGGSLINIKMITGYEHR